jgi:lipopolysaccharide/colanic/teichoic acid biosynthesis glycosyltransferase
LGGVSASELGFRIRTAVSQVAAVALLLLLWPLLLIMPPLLKISRRGPAIFKKQAIRLPTESDDAFWHTFNFLSFVPHDTTLVGKSDKSKPGGLRHFLLQFVPALLSVARGNLHFVGVRPRSREEIETLDSDWQDLYLKSKAGIITEAYINYGDHPTEDEIYTSEVFYASTTGLGHDFKLFMTYVRRLFKRQGKRQG